MPSYAIKSNGIRGIAQDRIIGRTASGAGVAEELTASTAQTLLGIGASDAPTFAAITQLSSSDSDPDTDDFSTGTWGLHKNTTSSKTYLAVNDSGSIVKQELGGSANPFDQDLNTDDDVQFAEITTTGDVSISESNTGKVTINGTTYGMKRSGTGIGFLLNNEHRFVMKTDRSAISGVYSGSTPHFLGFTNTTHADTASSAVDVRLQREAANHLAMVNGTNAGTFSVANTWTDASNYERGAIKWDSNILTIAAQAAGTGTKREIEIDPNSYVRIGNVDYYSAAGQIVFNSGNRAIKTGSHNGLRLQDGVTTAATTPVVSVFGPILTDDDGDQVVFSETPTYNQSGTAGSTDFLINRTETALGSGSHQFADFQVAGASKFKVDNAGDVTCGGVTGSGTIALSGTVVKLTNLPTSDPGVAGQLWSDAAAGGMGSAPIIKISTG